MVEFAYLMFSSHGRCVGELYGSVLVVEYKPISILRTRRGTLVVCLWSEGVAAAVVIEVVGVVVDG